MCSGLSGALPGLTSGTAHVSITQWETGAQGRKPSMAQFEVLATALGLSPAEKLYALQLARQDAAERAAESDDSKGKAA